MVELASARRQSPSMLGVKRHGPPPFRFDLPFVGSAADRRQSVPKEGVGAYTRPLMCPPATRSSYSLGSAGEASGARETSSYGVNALDYSGFP